MVSTINLLPWREMQRQTFRRHFFIKLAASFLAVFVITLLFRQIQYVRLDAQAERNGMLQHEIVTLTNTLNAFSKKEVVRDTLQRRLELVNALQKQRNNTTQLFNLLPEVIPEGVVLHKVLMNTGTVNIDGRSRSNAQLAILLARLEQQPAVRNVQIHSIENSPDKVSREEKQFRATFELAGYIVPQLPKENNSGR